MSSFRVRNGESGLITGGLHRPGKRSMASFAVRSHINDEVRLKQAIENGAAAQHNRVMQRLRQRRQSAAVVSPKVRHSSTVGVSSKLTHRGEGSMLTNKHTTVDLTKSLDFSSLV